MAVRVRNSSRVCVRGHEVGPSWFGDQRGCPVDWVRLVGRWGRAGRRGGPAPRPWLERGIPGPSFLRGDAWGSAGRKRVNAASGGVWPGGRASGSCGTAKPPPVAPSGPQRPQGRVRKALESTQASARAGAALGPHAGGGGVLRHGGTCPRGRSLHRPPVTRGWGTRRTRSGPLPAPGRALRGFGGRGRPGAIEGAARCVPQPESCVDGATPLRLDPCTLPWTSQKQV